MEKIKVDPVKKRVNAMLCLPFLKTELSLSSMNLTVGASLKDKQESSRKSHLVLKVQKRLGNPPTLLLIIVGYIINISNYS